MTRAVDLSTNAIEARRRARTSTGHDGGSTGDELITMADRVLKHAHKQQRIAVDRRFRGKRTGARKADDAADATLIKAAIQIRLAAITPLDRRYMHVHGLERIQQVRASVARDFDQLGSAKLALLTNRQITDQQARRRAERSTA